MADKTPIGKKSKTSQGKRSGGPLNVRSGKSSPLGKDKGQVRNLSATVGGEIGPGSLGAVMIRNDFYRDGYRNLQRMAIVNFLVIAGIVAAMLYISHIHQPENRYFATTEDGRLVPTVPLHEPNLSTPALMSWVSQATTDVMTFGFHDYRRRMQVSAGNFTRSGWASFNEALSASRILEMVDAQQQVVTATPSSAPILRGEGVSGGRYVWRVDIPLSVTHRSGTSGSTINYYVELTIVRVPRLENPYGVAIQKWFATAK